MNCRTLNARVCVPSPIQQRRSSVISKSSTKPTTAMPNQTNKQEGPLTVPRPPKLDSKDTILFQGFGWESHTHGNWWKHLQDQIEDIKACNTTHLWLPPASRSVAPQGYLPNQYYDLESKYGNKEDLVALNLLLLQAGIRPVADIVINHRSADAQDEHGVWNIFGDDVPHPGKKIDWGKWAITCNDPEFDGKGNKDTGADYGPSPDIDHANADVREGITDWLSWLKDYCGFEGFRFDFVKGYAPKYTSEYLEKTVGTDVFNVGEDFLSLAWDGEQLAHDQNAARQKLCDWCKAANCTAFDFVTKGILQEAMGKCEYHRLQGEDGKASGMLGWWPERAVTFVDNHDTGSTQAHWAFPDDKVMQGYAYILTHPGVPTVFYEHYFDWKLKEEIQKLTALRLRNGINAGATLKILAAEHDMYVAQINDNVVVKLGPRFDLGDLLPKESDGFKKAASGEDWAIWEKSS